MSYSSPNEFTPIIQLQIMAAPVVTFYPANEGPNKLANGKVDPFQYDFSN